MALFSCKATSIPLCGKATGDNVASNADQSSALNGVLLGAQPEGKRGAKTLVISLESLIFNTLQPLEDADFIINVEVDEIVYQVHVKKRPGIEKFLSEVAKDYEIIIWTSRAQYVNSCIDQIDTQKVVSYRLFREHCKKVDDGVVKDISLIGRPLKRTILIDDDPRNYLYKSKNSIPMHPWKGNSEDAELVNLLPLLTKKVKECNDVRKVLDAAAFTE